VNDSKTVASPPQSQPITLDDRLLAETVRLYEDARGFPLDEPQALEKDRAARGDLEQRIILRSQALSIAPALKTALQQLHNASTLVVVAGLLLGLLAGAAAAQAAFGSGLDGYVNFFWVLGGLLGVPTLALLLWLAMIAARPGNIATGFLGAATLGLGRWVNQRLHRGAARAAALQASASVLTQGGVGRWTLSAITHAIWLAFLGGCLTLVLLILSTKQYRFAWETTILSQPAYVILTRALATVPDALGFATPEPGQVAASQWTGQGQPSSSGSDAWAGLLVGCILVYGVLPRALLLLFSLLARHRAKTRFRLDTALSGYARLQTSLMPMAQSLGVVDAEQIPEQDAGTPSDEGQPTAIRPDGPTAILGLEIAPPKTDWPPALNGIEWLDLGFVDNRDDRHRVLDQLGVTPMPPRLILVVCALAATPDRGTRSFVHNLRETFRIPVFMVLTEGQHLRERGNAGQVAQRVEDWRQLASDAQVPNERVLEADLDHLTAASRRKLAVLLGVTASANSAGGHIAPAFELIITHVRSWPDQPDLAQQAELQRAVGKLYQGQPQSWQHLLRTGSATGAKRIAQVKTSADQMLALLPARLRARPKWLAAGALAGALGCVAAATLGATAAIATLPAWAGLGAAVSAALQAIRPGAPAADRPEVDLTEAVNAAALFALVLELQGRDEASISHIVDQVAGADEPPVIDGPDAAQAWLDSLHRRLDHALAREESM
jgi:hypothetical protein